MSRWIQEMTWPDIAEYLERGDTVLVPVGATEQHGPHCPMGTDAAEAVATAEGIAESIAPGPCRAAHSIDQAPPLLKD